MAYPFEEYFRLPHKCQQRSDEFLGTIHGYGRLDLECCGGCKLGTDYNEFFQTKPTADEVRETAKAFHIKNLQATQIAQERKRALFSQAQELGQIITLSFDKNDPDRIELMDYAMEEIKKAKVKAYNKEYYQKRKLNALEECIGKTKGNK